MPLVPPGRLAPNTMRPPWPFAWDFALSTIPGTSAQTLADFVSVVAGGYGPSGSANVTLDDFVLSPTGRNPAGGGAVRG